MSQIIKKLNVAANPHWRDGSSVFGIHLLWIAALMPALTASIYYFGILSLRVIALSIAFSVLFDAVSWYLTGGKDIIYNWSSVLLGILLALMMPVNATWWMVMTGCFIMIVIGKKLFGGLGAYPVHPAMLSYAMMVVSWPERFDFTASMKNFNISETMIEPIRLVKTLGSAAQGCFPWQDLLWGKQVYSLGGAMVIWLLLGGMVLLLLRKIRWQIPMAFLAGVAVTAAVLYWADDQRFAQPLFHLLSGGTVFAAFFLATDYTTSPVNALPMFIYGFIGGILLVLIRSFSVYSDGVVFTILLLNLCGPLLDRIKPKIYAIEELENA